MTPWGWATLPFALHLPCSDQGLCLEFPVEQALDRRAAGDVVSQEPLFFSSQPVSCQGAGVWQGWGEDAHVQGHCVYCHFSVLHEGEGSLVLSS